MAKKINLGTINNATMKKLSQFNVAVYKLRDLASEKNKELQVLEAERLVITKKRQEAQANGKTLDEVIREYSVVEIEGKIGDLEKKYKELMEDHKKNKKDIPSSLVPAGLYNAYQLAMQKGDLAAKGWLIIEKKSGDEKYEIDKSFKDQIKDFLVNIGCDASNNTALDKFVTVMSVRTAGMIQCNKGEHYVKVKSVYQFNTIFVRAFLEYCINDKGVITKNKDYTLSMTVYEDDQTKDQNKNQ